MAAAIVTGGSRGIGRAIAEALAASGHSVSVVSRTEGAAAAAAAELPTDSAVAGQRHVGVACDVSDAGAVTAVFRGLLEAVPRDAPLVLVNAAGVAVDGLLARARNADVALQCGVNLLGPMHTSRAVLRHMLRCPAGGCIVNVGSVVASQGSAGQSVYAGTKAGLEGFSRSLARELGPANVRVNVVAPGFVATDMTAGLSDQRVDAVRDRIPLGAFGDPKDVADAVLFLTRAKYVTGTVLTVDGGLSC